MRISQRGIDFICRWESLSTVAIRLPGEPYYTIGYGHYGPDVRPGQQISAPEAMKLLRQDLRQFERWVEEYTPFELNQNRFDALVSFTYNCGVGSLRQLVTGRTAAEAAEHITAYTASSSEAYREGLLNRRLAERAIFVTPDQEEMELTREELMTLEGTGDHPSDWAVEATSWAKERGLFQGDGQGNYGWQQPISREALAQLLWQLTREQ